MPIIIHIHKTERQLIGKSHWWGAPDLPADTPFPYVTLDDGTPEPLTFVCQIRCDDLAAHDPDGLLPHEGMLYVFAPLDHYLGDMDSPLDYHTKPCVFYTHRTDNLQPYEMCWEETDESVFLPAEEIEFEYTDEPSGDGHRLLTQPYEDEVALQHAGQLCLLQIDEADRMAFANLNDVSRGMGFCFSYWHEREKALRQFGIEWRSPAEMNPRVRFD